MTERSDLGQAVIEYLIMIPFALTMILGIIQIALIFNAHSMLELAAFNAARAAIVARGDRPEDPVTMERMEKQAKLAAFLTLLPVIPAFHGFTPTVQGVQSAFTSASSNTTGALGGLTGQAAAVALEQLMLKVKFLPPDSEDPDAEARVDDVIEFDDPERAGENVIKVMVEWQYPLVIPFINRILIAIYKPELYLAYRAAAAGGTPTADQALAEAQRYATAPPWELADFLTAAGPSSALGDALVNNLLFRLSMRATSVMRMQWDREPQSG